MDDKTFVMFTFRLKTEELEFVQGQLLSDRWYSIYSGATVTSFRPHTPPFPMFSRRLRGANSASLQYLGRLHRQSVLCVLLMMMM